MSDHQQTFSESWYRIATQKICLRSGVKVRRQNFRGKRWIVLENPFSNQFFRLQQPAYDFIARLRPDLTVQEVWQECMDRSPDETPGQEAVIQLLSQLYFSNLLQYDMATDSEKLFERYQKTRQREIRSRLMNIMFLRIPLFDPDAFLVRTMGLIGKLISPIGAILWLIVVGLGIKIGIENFSALKDQTEGVLAPGNLFLLYLGMVIVKALHEFGHAYFCRKFGGEVHTMGIMFLIFTPVPYMDATSSWGFRSRRQRMLVGAAGMIVEVFVAAIAAMIWVKTAEGSAIHSLAYNMMFVASVSTILFNINPLLRFDGYYILSDLLDIPNLHQRSRAQLKHLTEHYAFGVKKSESPAQSMKEAVWLAVFGVLSGIYRVFVFASILLFVADRFLLIGIIMGLICVVTWLIVPTGKLFQYLATSPKLERCRLRAVGLTAGLAVVVIVLLQVVPFPSHFRAPGVLEAKDWTQVVNQSGGYVLEILAAPGSTVAEGQALLQFHNPELDLEFQSAQASKKEIEARLLAAMHGDTAALRPLGSALDSVEHRLAQLQRDQDLLTVRARQGGIFVAPQVRDSIGRWLGRGTPIGLIVDPSAFEFAATVIQEDADRLFAGDRAGEIRLFGQAGDPVPLTNLRVIPAEQQFLPSPALGWAGGGEMAVSTTDPDGQRAAEPFFEVRADVVGIAGVELLHGRSGRVRFDLPSEPLLPRWTRRLQQLIQKRYQL